MICKEYKSGKKTVCHISKIEIGGRCFYFVRTGSPRAASCLCWRYDTLADAERTAAEYFENVQNFKKGVFKNDL